MKLLINKKTNKIIFKTNKSNDIIIKDIENLFKKDLFKAIEIFQNFHIEFDKQIFIENGFDNTIIIHHRKFICGEIEIINIDDINQL
tara:strand:- start:1076 stop:1336 length:261 start_codon:yes stop_codon:yes gene_type:complete